MEYQKEQADLDREAAVQDVEARKRFEIQLHAQLGKQGVVMGYNPLELNKSLEQSP